LAKDILTLGVQPATPMPMQDSGRLDPSRDPS
jgi:hypothetical protein